MDETGTDEKNTVEIELSVSPASDSSDENESTSIPAKGHYKRFITALLAVILIILILATAYIAITPHQGEKFTEFFILNADKKAQDYPKYFFLGEEKPVIVGIVNHEYRSVTYDLIVELNDSNRITNMYSNRFELNSNQTMETTIPLKPDHKGTEMRIEFKLFADGNISVPYRNLHLIVEVF